MAETGARSSGPSPAPETRFPATTAVAVVVLAGPALTAAGITDEARSAAAIVGWGALILALLFGLLPIARPGRRSRLAALMLGGLAAWTLLAVIWTDSDERTVVEVARTSALALFPVLAWIGVGPRNWRAAAWALVWVCLAIPAIAIVARLWPGLVSSLSPDLGGGLRRLAFPLGYWNALGAWSAAAMAAGLAVAAGARGDWRRALGGAAIPVAALAVYLSYSRTAAALALLAAAFVVFSAADRRRALTLAIVAAASSGAAVLTARSADQIALGSGGSGGWVVALVLLAGIFACAAAAGTSRSAVSGPGHRRRLDTKGTVIVATAVIAVVLAAAAVVSGPSDDAASAPVSEPEAVLRGDPAVRLVQLDSHRYKLWAAAGDAFASAPLQGIGPGAFSLWWERTREPGDEPVADAHSLYLETLAELGIVGLALLAGWLGAMVAAALAGRARIGGRTDLALWTALAAIAAVMLAAAAVDWIWESGVGFALALAALAVAAAPAGRTLRASRRFGRGRAGLILLAAAAFAVQAPVLVSTASQKQAAAALARGDLIAAGADTDRAIDAAPWAAEPYAVRARVRLRAGDLNAARADALVAIEREPTEPRYAALLERIDAAR